VRVISWQERVDRDTVHATVFVERDSQKGIVIGKGGRVIKALSVGARRRISELTGRPCDLVLQVAVARDWTRDPDQLSRLGYQETPEAPRDRRAANEHRGAPQTGGPDAPRDRRAAHGPLDPEPSS
jgi:hypothetical protein